MQEGGRDVLIDERQVLGGDWGLCVLEILRVSLLHILSDLRLLVEGQSTFEGLKSWMVI